MRRGIDIAGGIYERKLMECGGFAHLKRGRRESAFVGRRTILRDGGFALATSPKQQGA